MIAPRIRKKYVAISRIPQLTTLSFGISHLTKNSGTKPGGPVLNICICLQISCINIPNRSIFLQNSPIRSLETRRAAFIVTSLHAASIFLHFPGRIKCHWTWFGVVDLHSTRTGFLWMRRISHSSPPYRTLSPFFMDFASSSVIQFPHFPLLHQ